MKACRKGSSSPLPSPSQSCRAEQSSGERVRREEGGRQNQASTPDLEVWELSNMGTAEPRKDLRLGLGRRALSPAGLPLQPVASSVFQGVVSEGPAWTGSFGKGNVSGEYLSLLHGEGEKTQS